MLHQRLDDRSAADRPFGPDDWQASMQRNAGQNGHMRNSADGESLDRIEAVQFGLFGRHLRQIPAAQWCRTPHTFSPIHTVPLKDAANRPHRRTGRDSLGLQLSMNSIRSVLAQRTALFEPTTDGQDLSLQGGRRTLGAFGSTRSVFPVHPVQSLSCGPLDPVMNRARGHTESRGNFAERLASAKRRDHRATAFGGAVFQPLGSPGLKLFPQVWQPYRRQARGLVPSPPCTQHTSVCVLPASIDVW